MGDIAKPLTYSALSSIFPPESDYSQDYSWAAIVGVVLLGFGQEPRIKQLSETLLQQTKGDKEAQKIAFRKLREALLKSSPLVGFPRVRAQKPYIGLDLNVLFPEYQRPSRASKVPTLLQS